MSTLSASPVLPRESLPRIVSLEASHGALAAFAPECTVALRRAAPPASHRDDGGQARTLRLRVPRWVGPGGLAILGGAVAGMVIAVLFQPPVSAAPTSGAVTITSEPPGLTLRVDGSPRGVTPLATMLAAGPHRIEIGSGDRVRLHHLQVRPGMDASLHVAWSTTPPQPAATTPGAEPPADASPAATPAAGAVPDAAAATPAPERARVPPATAPLPPRAPAGALAIDSPFPVRVLVDGQAIGSSASTRLTVPAGVHTVTLVNERLEFEQTRELTVAARRTETLVVEPPLGTLHVNAQPWAHVIVDGQRAGDTPLGNLSLPIGEHEVVLRHPDLGEERRTVTVGARTPVRVGVELPH